MPEVKHNVFQYYGLYDGVWKCQECKTEQVDKPGEHAEGCALGKQEKEMNPPWLNHTDKP